MYATASLARSPFRMPRAERGTARSGRNGGSRGDHCWSSNNDNNNSTVNASRLESHLHHDTEHILRYYYHYAQSQSQSPSEDGAAELSSNDDELSTTALQGHPGMSTTNVYTANSSFARNRTVSASSSGTNTTSGDNTIHLSDAAPVSAPPDRSVFSIPDYSAPGHHHHRSASDVQPKHKRGRSSRDIGIVGIIGTSLTAPAPLALKPPSDVADPADVASLPLPLFQTPRSRSPSPSSFAASVAATPVETAPTHPYDTMSDHHNNNNNDLEDTPTRPAQNHVKHASVDTPRTSIERERDKQKHSTRLAFKPAQPPPLSYLYYQPTLHSTAGPLPSPPRRIYNLAASNSIPPPRPPRLTPSRSRPGSSERPPSQIFTSPEATSSQLHLSHTPSTSSDYSLTAVSVLTSENEQIPQNSNPESDEQTTPSRPANQTEITNADTDGHTEPPHTSNHTREGAFGISTVGLEQPSKSESKDIDDRSTEDKAEVFSIISSANQSPPPDPIQSERKESPPSSRSLTSDLPLTSPPSSPSSYGSSSEPPTKLPPLPVLLERQTSATLPLPPLTPEPIIDTFYQPMTTHMTFDLSNKLSAFSFAQRESKKPPSDWPDAMNFKEILSMKSSKERASAYSAKFRELMREETGLRHWVTCVAKKDRNERGYLDVPSPAMNQPSHKQIRHVSRGSIASEATFPIRQDAYTATDLMSKPVADMPSSMTAPPSLPYPSLAQGIGIRKRSSKNFSVDSPFVSPAQSARSLGGGFFASIGRKASLRKDRALPPVSPTKRSHTLLQPPSHKQQQQQQQSRVVKLEHAPTLPGGPRAPPRSAHRSSTLIYPRKLESSSSSLLSKRHSVSPGRRSVDSNSSFDRRLETMADLLPHVDKPVLSAYLRRAQNNDPMTAISDYLEDAKNNDVRVS